MVGWFYLDGYWEPAISGLACWLPACHSWQPAKGGIPLWGRPAISGPLMSDLQVMRGALASPLSY